MLRGLQFEPWVATLPRWRNRMDIACFIGFAERRTDTALPMSILQWLRERGFIDTPGQPSTLLDTNEQPGVAGGVWNLPIPIDDWSMFEQLFQVRSIGVDASTPLRLPSYLAAAVRSFFVQGGRRCIVVAVEQPSGLFLRSPVPERLAAIGQLVPELAGDLAGTSPFDRSAWRGLGVLHGVEDASLVSLPDLPWLVGQVPPWLTPVPPEVVARAGFVECSDAVVLSPEEVAAPPIAIGRCDLDEYIAWSDAVRAVSRFLARHRRDVQLVAALPLPAHGSALERDPVNTLLSWGILERGDEGQGALSDHGVASRFLQLCYPWLGWRGSRGLPENLEPPDGAIAGMIARSTLLRGAFHSAAGSTAYELERVHPVLSRAQQEREPDVIPATGGPIEGALLKRLSFVGRGLHRFELLSDVTSSGDTRHQLGGIQRLNAVWIRALEQAGQSLLFEPSNEGTWAQVRRALTEVGMALFRGGAFRGESPSQAFRVRCDRTTMSQRDIDSARLVAEIEYRPVAPVELIRVFLSLAENREVSVLSEASELPA